MIWEFFMTNGLLPKVFLRLKQFRVEGRLLLSSSQKPRRSFFQKTSCSLGSGFGMERTINHRPKHSKTKQTKQIKKTTYSWNILNAFRS